MKPEIAEWIGGGCPVDIRPNLVGADLRAANLREDNLRKANLTATNLRGANLNGADLREADMRGADLTDVKWDKHTKWFSGCGYEQKRQEAEREVAEQLEMGV